MSNDGCNAYLVEYLDALGYRLRVVRAFDLVHLVAILKIEGGMQRIIARI